MAGLALLFSRQLLNGSQDFFFGFNILILFYFFKYKVIETHARAFLPLNISAVGSVSRFPAGPSLMHHTVCVFARLFWNCETTLIISQFSQFKKTTQKHEKKNTPSKICLPYCASSLSFACHILKTKNMLWIFHFRWITMFSDGLIRLKIFKKIKKKSNLHLKIYPNHVLIQKVNNPQSTNT